MSTQRLPPVPGTTHPGWRSAKPELTSQKRPEATNVLDGTVGLALSLRSLGDRSEALRVP